MAMAEPAAATPVVDAEYLKEIDVARRHLRALIYGKQCAPIMLRLSFHDAGTYDARTRTGGPNGSIRHRNELSRVANSGINVAVDFCEQIKAMHPRITYADLYQLAGVVAVEVTGGPQIDFVPGRKVQENRKQNGRLPNPNQGSSHLREVFYRMGLSDRDIVVLSGAHTLGRAHQERSGFDGAWTKEPFKFDNSYFVELARGETQGLLQMPTDKALMEDPRFREFVMLYAEDEDAFLEDYAISHKKMSELGFSSAIWRKVRALLWLQHLKALVGFSRRAKNFKLGSNWTHQVAFVTKVGLKLELARQV
ncbi:L-ascorbate peroxidase 3 [Linum perenne]